jgi:NAD(P)-dependent dehydrogenase (short-subunit alcohol dehydrogenase family)
MAVMTADEQARAGLLEGQVAVVTGGAAGIGGGASRQLAAAGATVVINDIDPALLATAVAEIEAVGGSAVAVPGDIRHDDTVTALVAAAWRVADGRIDVLVNNVGDYRPNGRFLKTGPDEWAALYALNFEHVLRCTRAVAPTMVERGSGSIVNVSTVEAFRGIPANAAYSAFNAAVNAFTRSLAVELGRDGVRVNAIAPDLADTLQTPAASMLRGRDPDMVRHWVPLGRFGHPDDYAEVVLFLASDMARFVTGHVIPVDGGTLAAGGWYLRSDERGWTNLPDAP